MAEQFRMTREIGIDAGHRVTNHHSKCKGLHGHRYKIQATIGGALETKGSTEGMVGGMDFGFLKEEMMNAIDRDCDHAMILWSKDPILEKLNITVNPRVSYELRDSWAGKIYIMDEVPTAENLARHWFRRLAPRVSGRSKDAAELVQLRVHETPNCWADAFRQ